MSDRETDFTVVGAGLAGALMSCYLARDGHRVQVLERRGDPRTSGGGEGRSINLALSARGLDALEQVGLAEEVLANAVPMRGRMMHAESGKITFQSYGTKKEDVINSVSRAGLNTLLINAAEYAGDVRVTFDARISHFDLENRSLILRHGRGPQEVRERLGVVVGADGAFSTVRSRLQRVDRTDYRQDYLEYGYMELTIPSGPNGAFQLEPNALHIWPRGGSMMIALPNADGSFTCTLFWPLDGPFSFGALQTANDVQSFFERHYADAVPLMPTLAQEYLGNPTSSLVTIRCGPWSYEDWVVLIGDACHAVVPFYGQGANAAFADCPVLADSLKAFPDDRPRAFRQYYEARKQHVDVLADLAISNFVEMRDHVGSPVFLIRKRLERGLHRLFPRWFVPLYSLVSFSLMPYGDAVRRATMQTIVVRVVLAILGVILVLAAVWLWS